MRKRIDAGTDGGKIGAWDAGLDALCTDGRVFFISTGGDGDWPVDVLVGEELSEYERLRYRAFDGRFLLSVPSGQLVVDGLEAVGSRRLGVSGVVDVPPGDYALTCYLANATGEEDGGNFASIGEVEEKVLTPEERTYYRKVSRGTLLRSAIIWLILLSFFLFRGLMGWKLAVVVVVALITPYAHWLERRSKRQPDEKWMAINQKVTDAWAGDRRAEFVLELRRVEQREGLRGGSVSVDDLPDEERGFEVKTGNRD